METDASIDRRDAFAASMALLALTILWVALRLYWQSALLLAAGLGLGYLGWFRPRGAGASERGASGTDARARAAKSKPGSEPKGTGETAEPSAKERSGSKGSRKKSKKKKR